MNLNSIFENNIIKTWSRFDYIYSLEIKWVLAWFKKMAKLEPFTLWMLKQIKDTLQLMWLKYTYIERDDYFDEEKMLFLKNWKTEWEYIDLYISKSSKILLLIEKLSLIETDVWKKNYLIWKLLWYPDCCIKEFLKTHYSNDFEFNMSAKKRTIWKLDWRLNNLINPYSLIPFFPCSYNCHEAIKYANENLKLFENPNIIKEMFKSQVLYNSFWDITFINKNDKKKLEQGNVYSFE